MKYYSKENIQNVLERIFKRRNVAKKHGKVINDLWKVSLNFPTMEDFHSSSKWLGKNLERLNSDGITEYFFIFPNGSVYSNSVVNSIPTLLAVLEEIKDCNLDFSFDLLVNLSSIQV